MSNPITKDDDFYVIGIGASAGGLEALKIFFSNVSYHINHSFVVIQHLRPDYKSLMTELLAKDTKLPIYEVLGNTIVEPGSIYLVPAQNNLIIRDNILRLVDRPQRNTLNLPIDIFLTPWQRKRVTKQLVSY